MLDPREQNLSNFYNLYNLHTLHSDDNKNNISFVTNADTPVAIPVHRQVAGNSDEARRRNACSLTAAIRNTNPPQPH